MNTSVMISTLRMGKTGTQILEILDAITSESPTQTNTNSDTVSDTNSTTVSAYKPTLDPIEFQLVCATNTSVTINVHWTDFLLMYTH